MLTDRLPSTVEEAFLDDAHPCPVHDGCLLDIPAHLETGIRPESGDFLYGQHRCAAHSHSMVLHVDEEKVIGNR